MYAPILSKILREERFPPTDDKRMELIFSMPVVNGNQQYWAEEFRCSECGMTELLLIHDKYKDYPAPICDCEKRKKDPPIAVKCRELFMEIQIVQEMTNEKYGKKQDEQSRRRLQEIGKQINEIMFSLNLIINKEE